MCHQRLNKLYLYIIKQKNSTNSWIQANGSWLRSKRLYKVLRLYFYAIVNRKFMNWFNLYIKIKYKILFNLNYSLTDQKILKLKLI